MAFTKRELMLVSDSYFEIISEAEMYIELKSINTDHCWNIFKNTIEAGRHVILYHKYKIDEKHYKKYRDCKTVSEAVDIIRLYDAHVLEKKSKATNSNMPDRRLKVYSVSDKKYQSVPQIRLQGKWLEELGFVPGASYIVKSEDGKLILISEN